MIKPWLEAKVSDMTKTLLFRIKVAQVCRISLAATLKSKTGTRDQPRKDRTSLRATDMTIEKLVQRSKRNSKTSDWMISGQRREV